jgi:hypothetical protein
MELEECLEVLLPDMEVLAMIKDKVVLQEAGMLLNLDSFLADQIEFKRLMIAAMIESEETNANHTTSTYHPCK